MMEKGIAGKYFWPKTGTGVEVTVWSDLNLVESN